ncbi:hypothetical protein HMPREF9370_0089 [Neisseria wadsworthii 9715]|uniref:Uncharacterized protein n=3 Tax=Neisseria TaxID=482 RepID=G4CLY0_9NEIS|nr:hypothetical protein HMPREF9370_0089 [Neisseria wadsworthii 9715]
MCGFVLIAFMKSTHAAPSNTTLSNNSLLDTLVKQGATYSGIRTATILQASPVSSKIKPKVPAKLAFTRSGAEFKLSEHGPRDNQLVISVLGKLQTNGGWRGQDEEVRLTIDPNGNVNGSAYDGPLVYQISGRVSEKRAVLRVQQEAVEGSPERLAGLRHVYNYSLDRQGGGVVNTQHGQKQKAAVQQAKTANKGKCKKVRWKLKPSMNYSSGTIDTVRVPVCVK